MVSQLWFMCLNLVIYVNFLILKLNNLTILTIKTTVILFIVEGNNERKTNKKKTWRLPLCD